MKPLLLDVKSLLKDSIHVKELTLPYLDDDFHYHNAYEISYILKSKGRRVIGDNIEDFTDGDLILLGPHLPHLSYTNKDYLLEDSNSNVEALVIYFYPDWLTDKHFQSTELVKVRELLENMKRGIKVLGETKQKVIKSMLKLKKSYGLGKIITILQILDIISTSGEYECLASEGYSNHFSQQDVHRIDAVYQYVMKNFTETIKLNEIAAIASMTPTAFCKYFKQTTKKTFSLFVNEIRIGYACKLLCKENLSISQVCFLSGFNNLTNFNKNFKHFTKMIPTEYKAHLMKEAGD